ncbi:MAG: hypothetical protein OXF41_08310 [bacterium]|nr:hypothetical protein [bacterium]
MPVLVVGPVDEFLPDGAEERLGGGVIPAHPGPSYRLADAICATQLGSSPRRVLGTAVSVEDHVPYLAASGCDRFAERVGGD